MLDPRFVRRILLAVSAALLLTTLQLLPSRTLQPITDAQQRINHTLRVLEASEEVLVTLDDAETNERGYLLTGDVRYLPPFQSAVAEQMQAKLKLRQLTSDNYQQQVRIGNLDQLVTIRLAALTHIIGLYRTEGPKVAAAAVASGGGSIVMGRIRGLMSDIKAEEYGLLTIRTKRAEIETANLKTELRIGGALLVVLLAVFAAVSERDVSSHRRSEALVKESEEQFHTLANAIPQLCWIADGEGGIFWYNQRWYDFTGTTLEDMTGWGWQSVHDPEVLPLVMTRWKAAIESGEPFEMVFPLRAADGTFHPFFTKVMPVCDPNGNVLRWFGTNTDITAQRITEGALRENHERLRLAHEVAQIGTFEWNVEAGTKQRTPELEAMYGLPPGAFGDLQKTWIDFVCQEDQERVRRQMEQARQTGSFEAEWRLLWPNGDEHWHFGRARILKNDQGRPMRVIGAILDITERKRAALSVLQMNVELEQRVRERTLQLEAANKELGAFAYSVSHDLRAPLRGIDGWSLALLEDYGAQLDKKAHQYLNRVRSETQRMGNLIDDMLQLSRVTRDEMKLDPVDLTAMAGDISASLQEAQPGRAIEFVIQQDLVAVGDGRLLSIALTNLFSNAVKFTGKKEKARVEFGKVQNQDEGIFYLRDNGAGFDMTYASTLFGAFQRLHKATEFPGTGIGLAIVQRVVNRHGGRVWADAQVDGGATFWFTLEAQL